MALTDDIFHMTDAAERTMAFEKVYMFTYHRLANDNCEKARVSALEKMRSNFAPYLTELEESEVWKEMIEKGAQVASAAALKHGLNALVASEIVSASVGGAVSATGRRGAVFVVEQTTGMAAAQGAHAAAYGVKIAGRMGTLLPGICALAGQSAGEFIADKAQIENYHLKNGLSVGGSMAAAAAAGAMVGGPVGALAGTVVGAGSWGVGKAIDALVTSGLGVKGPGSNWACIKTGTIDDKVCIGTYGASDTLYWKTYWNEYRSSDCSMFVMSAGQSQTGSFQLCVWDRYNNVIKHLNKVYYRDFIHVGSIGKYNYVAHCKGEAWGGEGGSVHIY